MAELRHHQRPIVLLPLVDIHQRRERYKWEAARTARNSVGSGCGCTRTADAPDDIDRDSKRAQHHEAIVAWCVAVHVCANQVNSSSDAVPLHL